MDKVTQSNASNAEETAAAAEELNAQAHALNEAVIELRHLVGAGSSGASASPAALSPVRSLAIAKPTVHKAAPRIAQRRTATPVATAANSDAHFLDA